MQQFRSTYRPVIMDDLERERLGENLRRRFKVEGAGDFTDLLHQIDAADRNAMRSR